MYRNLFYNIYTESRGDVIQQVIFPEYDEDKEIFLGVFSSPAPTYEAYKICKEAGFNAVLIDHNYAKPGSEKFDKLINYCEKNGIKAYPMRIDMSPAEFFAFDYNQCSAFDGVFFYDEPGMQSFGLIAEWAEKFEKKYPESKFLVNLFPSFATPAQLGTSDYKEYVQSYKEQVLDRLSGYKQLSVDHYALLKGENRISKGWLKDLETISQTAIGTDIVTHYYILTVEHEIFRSLKSVSDVRFQYAVAMAYGFKAFSAFTYPTQANEAWGDALVTQKFIDGDWITQKNCNYSFVQQANKELLLFDHVYLSFDYRGTMPIMGWVGTTCGYGCYSLLQTPLHNAKGIAAIKSEQDCLVGCFADEEENTAYMVVNFTDPIKKLENKVEIEFDGKSRARVYRRGLPQDFVLEKNSLSVSLEPGEGVFILTI